MPVRNSYDRYGFFFILFFTNDVRVLYRIDTCRCIETLNNLPVFYEQVYRTGEVLTIP